MLTIIDSSREFTPVETYLMTQSQDIKLLKDVEDGTEIDVVGYLVYSVAKDNDDEKTMLSLITEDKTVYTTISETFRDEFIDIWDILKADVAPIIKKSGTTSKGRTFLTCTLNVSKVM